MTNKITEQKFEEVKALMERIQEITLFNPEITTVQAASLDIGGDEMHDIIGAKGSRQELLHVLKQIVKQLTLNMLTDHPCACIPIKMIEAAVDGIDKGIEEAEKQGVKINAED
ncbi:hypothetical protein JH67_02875 [Listeria monocytogenes]|nr:hypothetical protein [Listeria monocytogenes]